MFNVIDEIVRVEIEYVNKIVLRFLFNFEVVRRKRFYYKFMGYFEINFNYELRRRKIRFFLKVNFCLKYMFLVKSYF